MTAKAGSRKLALLIHVTSSIAWVGAVCAFLALAIVGLTSKDMQAVRGAYVAMGMITSFVIVPFGVASLVTGVVSSLTTTWGLFRHYWVVVKLLLTVFALSVLLMHTQPINLVATAATDGALSNSDLRDVRIQLLADANAGLLVLLLNTGLGIFKPRGLTRFGWRKQREQRTVATG